MLSCCAPSGLLVRTIAIVRPPPPGRPVSSHASRCILLTCLVIIIARFCTAPTMIKSRIILYSSGGRNLGPLPPYPTQLIYFLKTLIVPHQSIPPPPPSPLTLFFLVLPHVIYLFPRNINRTPPQHPPPPPPPPSPSSSPHLILPHLPHAMYVFPRNINGRPPQDPPPPPLPTYPLLSSHFHSLLRRTVKNIG